ncbi:MAG: uridine diphosphate-N-acetylglucosamine-binding protein YvcK [Dehalococcoidia bacterium]
MNNSKQPEIVVIGGGTGLSILLKGIKTVFENISAIIGVSDDGGSSGELRKEFGILPPGDFRNCLIALSNSENNLIELLNYRFKSQSKLNNHNLGNLILFALDNITHDFEESITVLGELLNIKGKIVPAALTPIDLTAKLETGTIIQGETNIRALGEAVKEIKISPVNIKANPNAIKIIEKADLILVGPGSLYSSIIPNLLIKEIKNAILNSKAQKYLICNVATENGETNNYDSNDHIQSIQNHLNKNIFDSIIVNNNIENFYSENNVKPVIPQSNYPNTKIIYGDVVNENNRIRHDSNKLADLIKNSFKI